MHSTARHLAVFVAAFVVHALVLAQEPAIPTLTRHMTDLTGTLSSQQVGALDNKLRQFEDSTSNQIVVLMIPTLGSASLEDYSLRVAEANRIGVKGRDNGALLFIAKDDRRVRIEVGYGLEGALPDIVAGQIIRHEIGPHFQSGEYYEGIDAAIDAMMAATKGEYKAEKKDKSPAGIGPLVIFLVILFLILRSMFWRPRGLFGRRRSYWGGGPFFGGFGGFGGGGFGGGGGGGGGFSGGGGSFGGGGASGGW